MAPRQDSLDDATPAPPAGRFRRFLLLLLLPPAAALAIIAAANYLAFHDNFSHSLSVKLYHHQLDKLARQEPASILFVGDSSLGNAIDAELFASLAGGPVLSLPLAGSFGYAGSYNMIRRTLEHAGPKVVVVMQTASMMGRPFSEVGYLRTAPDGDWPWFKVPLSETARAYLTMDNLEQTVSGLERLIADDPYEVDYDRDYIRQGPALDEAEYAKVVDENSALTPASIDPRKPQYLHRIVALCRERSLTCLYAHGPLLQTLCQPMAPYLDAANAAIEATGITLLHDTPPCLPREQMGDSEDHAAPAMKDEVTRFYYRLIAPYLPPAAG